MKFQMTKNKFQININTKFQNPKPFYHHHDWSLIWNLTIENRNLFDICGLRFEFSNYPLGCFSPLEIFFSIKGAS